MVEQDVIERLLVNLEEYIQDLEQIKSKHTLAEFKNKFRVFDGAISSHAKNFSVIQHIVPPTANYAGGLMPSASQICFCFERASPTRIAQPGFLKTLNDIKLVQHRLDHVLLKDS